MRKKPPKFSRPFVDRSGKRGLQVDVEFETATGHRSEYRVLSHGKKPAEVVDEIKKKRQHHEKKAARIEQSRALGWFEFTVGDSDFIVTDIVITDRGDDVLLTVVFGQVVAGKTKRFRPIRKYYGSIDEVPDNAGILAMVSAAAEEFEMRRLEAEEFTAELNRLIGEQGV